MKWLVQHKSRKDGFQIDLPDSIIDREPFDVVADGVPYRALWNRDANALSLTTIGEARELIYSTRSCSIESFDDEPETSIDMEYQSPGGRIKGYLAKAEIHVPGLKHKKSSDDSKGALMRAPMAGKVLSVAIKEGSFVEKGQIVCVIEAMKMENQIAATVSGKILGLAIKVGDQLSARAKMLTIQDN